MWKLLTRRPARAKRPRPTPAFFERLEERALLAVGTTLGVLTDTFVYNDVDGDQVTVVLRGAGTVDLTLKDNAVDLADLDAIAFHDTDLTTSLAITLKKARIGPRVGNTVIGSITGGTVGSITMTNASLGGDLNLSGSLRQFRADAIVNGADFILGSTPPQGLSLELLTLSGLIDNPVNINIPGGFSKLAITNDAAYFSVNTDGDLNNVNFKGAVANASFTIGGAVRAMDLRNGVADTAITVASDLDRLRIVGNGSALRIRVGGSMTQFSTTKNKSGAGSLLDTLMGVSGAITNLKIAGGVTDSTLAATEGMDGITTGAAVTNSMLLAGTTLDTNLLLDDAAFGVATIDRVTIGGDFTDSILAAGGDPGADRLFAYKEVLPGGKISHLTVKGIIAAVASPHPNPGIYAAELGPVSFEGRTGPAVIDPLPSPANALSATDVQDILERAIARARQLGVSATISVVDREGNVLGIVRMDGALTTENISGGGAGGIEAIDGLISTSIIATTKAGTAAFLSTSRGNAFSTRTAAQIIQEHFPPGVSNQPGGPLFGVQLSNLPTSDVNRLPLGLSADPGGLPLYRGGELLGGIGVEIDGEYTVTNNKSSQSTTEEKVALAGQVGMAPKANIRADKIFINGIRLPYANGSNPKLSSLTVTDLTSDGAVDIIVAPQVSPASGFALTFLGNIQGEAPNNTLYDFYNDTTDQLTFLDGVANGGEQLTAAEVQEILQRALKLGGKLRAGIRRDSPQRAQVTVSVVDLDGNLLGAFRNTDAPLFGYDVSVQKARTAAFMSRPDAGAELVGLGAEFAGYVDAASDIGLDLDGSVALSTRAIGFLSRPNLPDGIKSGVSGPFTAQPPDTFSPFNTGLQTALLLPNLGDFLTAFNALPEAAAWAQYQAGTLGGPSVVRNDSHGGGLPGNSLANGLQIFSGGVPLYKNGVLVGAIGVSGDGVEQDDYVAFAGATDYAPTGDVRRADQTLVAGGIRLPYVKLPRSPFAGV
ncbi:MAG: heme-binding protein [Planctomycetes bacterium]|nr:heme-binding protein [Planctomycetota bacterium]